MAKLGDDIEQFIDESMPFCFEKLGDTSALKAHGCLTVAQLALLMPAMLTFKMPCDASEMAAHYIQLALLDITHGELDPKHPQTHLPNSQYLRMMKAGMFGIDGADLPMPTADWLVSLDEAERWLHSKAIYKNFDGIRADLKRMREDGLDTWPDDAAPVLTEKQAAPATQEKSPAADSWQVEARKIADELFDRDTKNRCRDCLKGYSNRVMEEMQSRGVFGPRGLIDNANTIQREALQGMKWWANKPKS
ncbi:MAG: hypothetical protein ACOH2K_05325 [Burkholderiaceae bacterium]